MRHLYMIVWGLLLFLGLSGLTGAADETSGERILSFASSIQVQPDASLVVTEAIVVKATGDLIKRGIVRDFPTVYKDRFGNRVKVGFKVLEARRDGVPETYRVESAGDGKKIYLGQKDIFLSPGVYTYTLKYRTTRQLGFFKDFDELYWNVTGHAWTFPLERAEAVVVLPPGGKVRRYAAYTGVLGAKDQDFRASVGDGRVVFTSTRSFAPGEGMTIAVAWPKGFVQPPTRLTRIRDVLEDNPVAILACLAVLAVLVYYLVVWYRVGRDHVKGTIIPLFEPPQGLSPAAMRLVNRMGLDDKAFAATLVQMAVKGWLVIESHDGDFTLSRPGKQPSVPLTSLETQILSKLFLGKDVLRMNNSNHENIKSAENALKNNPRWEVEKKYFTTNSDRLAWGVVLSLLAVVLAVLNTGDRDSIMISGFLSLWLSVWTFATIGLWMWSGKGERFFPVSFTVALVLVISCLLFFAPLVGMVFVTVVCLNILFYFLLKAYTLIGRRLMDQIEGFRMYLTAAEQERLELLHPPARTPELFEKYLPFALALDVENEWCEQFSEVLDKAGYAPGWYQGASWHSLGAGGLSTSLGTSLSASLSSSSSPPGSSSGSSGGGSSGGGGGGGGGSGW